MISNTLNIVDKVTNLNKMFPLMILHIHVWSQIIELFLVVYILVARPEWEFEEETEEERQQLIEEDSIKEEDKKYGEQKTGKDT